MKIYIIDNVRTHKRAAPTLPQRNTYARLEQRFQENHLSHGNILAHICNPLRNQVSYARDKKAKRDKGRHLNEFFVRSQCFCNDLHHSYERAWSEFKSGKKKKLYLPLGYKLEELYRGIIYIYDKNVVEKMVQDGLADFMRLAKHSKTHRLDYSDSEEYLGEYYILDRKNTPDPIGIMIGALGPPPLPLKHRIDLEGTIFYDIKNKFPKTKILYYKNVTLLKHKYKHQTGNTLVSLTGINILKAFFAINSGKIEPTRII